MRISFLFIITSVLIGCHSGSGTGRSLDEGFSVRLLDKVRNEKNYLPLLDSLSRFDIETINSILDTDAKKIAFWINTYNSLVQIELKEKPAKFKTREFFFEDKYFHISGSEVSLNDIENGILRSKKIDGFPKNLESLKVRKLDPRIHFALNCGALSCPPISFYNSKDLDKQLRLAEKVFIENSSFYDPFSDEVSTSELLKWYAEDFGGETGILILLKRNVIVPPNANPDLIWEKYNWSPQSGNFND
jgi:hypothetical protein